MNLQLKLYLKNLSSERMHKLFSARSVLLVEGMMMQHTSLCSSQLMSFGISFFFPPSISWPVVSGGSVQQCWYFSSAATNMLEY